MDFPQGTGNISAINKSQERSVRKRTKRAGNFNLEPSKGERRLVVGAVQLGQRSGSKCTGWVTARCQLRKVTWT